MCFCIIDAPWESEMMHGPKDERTCSLGEAVLLCIFAEEIQAWQAAGLVKEQAARNKHQRNRPSAPAALAMLEWRKAVRKVFVLKKKRAAEETVAASDDLPPCPLCGEIPATLKTCMEHDCDGERLCRTTALT